MSHEWMRNDRVDILKYLPSFLGRDKHFKIANDADSIEHDAIRADLQDLLDQLYVVTATWGMEKWEELVDITPQDGADIAARRAAVIQKLGISPSVTQAYLQSLINRHITDKSGLVEADNEHYAVDFTIPLGKVPDSNALFTDIDTYIPAHLGRKVRIRDNPVCELFCEATEYDKESLVESFIYNGTATARYGFAMAAGRYFGRRDVFGAGFHDDMSMHCRAYTVCAEFDKEMLVSGD